MRGSSKSRAALAATGVLALATLTGCAAHGLEDDGVYTIKMADSYPLGHPFSEAGAQAFMDQVEEESEGRVRFEYYPAEQMGDAADFPTLVRSGVVDMASIAPAYSPADLPLSGVADLPGLVPDSCTGSVAVKRLMSEGGILYREDFEPKGIRPLVTGMIPDYDVMTKSDPVADPDDIRSLQLRSSGGTIDRTVEDLGASPIGMPATEMYEAISRGTVDGTVLGPVSAAPYHLEEVLGHATEGARLGSFTMTYSISEETFESLPSDLQKIFLDAGDAATRSLCTALQEKNVEGRQQLRDAGVDVHVITPGELPAWQRAVEPVLDRWADDQAAIGRPGQDALDELEKELERTDVTD